MSIMIPLILSRMLNEEYEKARAEAKNWPDEDAVTYIRAKMDGAYMAARIIMERKNGD
jgi:hypothetical protein